MMLPTPEDILADSEVDPDSLIGPAEIPIVPPNLPAKGKI
jgi:hypothetical protein